MAAGEVLQLKPSAAFFARAVASTAQQKQAAVIAERQPLATLIHIHPIHVWSALQSQHIRPALVQLQPIAAEFTEKGEVGCDDDVVRFDGAVFCDSLACFGLQHPRMLINLQALRNCGSKFQRMKLGLVIEAHRSGHRKGKGSLRYQLGGTAQLVQRGHLLVQLFPAVQGVDVIGLLLKIAGDILTYSPKPVQRLQIGIQVGSGPLPAEFLQQLVVNQPVLNSELGGGVLCHVAADPSGLRQHAVHPGLSQLIGAQQPGQPASDDQHISMNIAAQRLKFRQPGVFFPNRLHSASPL